MPYSPRDLEIVNHYANAYGQANQTFQEDNIPEPAPSTITVLEFAPPSPEYDWEYATVGASSRSIPSEQGAGPDAQHRMELVVYSRKRQPELADLLINLSVYPFLFGTYFASGHTIAGSPGGGVVTGSNLTEILLIHPIFQEPEFEYIHHKDGTHTQILFVVPLHLSERTYAKEHGYLELIDLFGKNKTDTSDLARPPVV
jgi:hypothetical protein